VLPASRYTSFSNVVENPAAFANGGDNAREVVVGEHHVRRLARDFRASSPHRDADVRLAQSGGVVHAVAGHCHDRASSFRLAHDAELVFGRGSRVHTIVGSFGT
jgi:hypothetical protein